MKTRKIILGICLLFLGIFAKAQNGLENIYVERYYVTDAIDATNSIPPIPVGAVTYRIYADLLPGYKLQTVYGAPPVGSGPTHPMTMTTSTYFFNQGVEGNSIPSFSANTAKSNTVMLDSWLSTGGACNNWKGVPKSEDNGVNNFVNSNVPKLLQNNAAQAGIPLTTQDGMLTGAVPATATLGLDDIIGIFGDGSANGNSFLATDGSWFCLAGATGAIPATNKVLIAQITTDGIFHFELNIQIGTPSGGTEIYVHSNPLGDERSIPSLIQTMYPVPFPPTVSITSPAEGSTFTVGSPIAISADAADFDGSVTQVEFFVDGTSIGVDATTPYTASYTGVAEEGHVLLAKATDNDGQLVESTPVNFSVIAPIPPATSTWTGAVSNDWNLAGNWNPSKPGAITDVTIPAGLARYPTLSAAGTCHNILFGSTDASTATLLDNGFLTVTGTATVQRYFTGNTNDWHLVSSPVAAATSSVFSGMYLQSFSETTSLYSEITSEAASLNVMEGYGLYSTLNAANTVSFTGDLNLGTKSRAFTKNNTGWNLLGNPFVSSLDWENVVIPTGMSNEVHYIQASTGNDLTYVKGVGGAGSQYIAPMQGFFVSATGTGSLELGNAQRTHSGSATFYKSGNPKLVTLEATGANLSDQVLIHFNEQAGVEHDGQYDAYKVLRVVNPKLPQIYSLTPTGVKLAVNGMPAASTVQVEFTAGEAGTFNIKAVNTGDFSQVTLEDTKTGVFTDMLKDSYAFNFVPGETAQRFVLHFGTLSTNEKESSGSIIYSYNKTVYVNFKSQAEGDIFIYNLSGQLISTKTSAKGMNEIGLNVVTGNYIVKVITRDNTVVKKVYIN